MKRIKKFIVRLFIIFAFGLIPSLICQFFTKTPTSRYLHIRSFRYGKDPSVIRCNRGDTLHLTFSTDDTGHSFFLEEFDIDAKVTPSDNNIEVFKTSDPTAKPLTTKELIFIARHPGIFNYIVARSNFRCHVWCGTMHAFEQGKLVILPNTLLVFSLGCLYGILFLWLMGMFRKVGPVREPDENQKGYRDLLAGSGLLKKLVVSRWPQMIVMIFAMVLIYIVILTSVLGTKVSGRNLGVLLMWAIWLFFLVAVLTPFFGRIWCTICPLPFFGDWIQRSSFFSPFTGMTGGYNNIFSGLFLKWPAWLSNDWPRLFVFMLLATFSTTLVATPIISGITVLMLLLVPTVMSMVWELRTFCRYVCPVSVFVGPYSRMSMLSVRNKSQVVCDRCKPQFCRNGSSDGWACPYGINVGELKENSECGVCLECMRSCKYNNVSMFKRPFASELGTRNYGQAWLSNAVFILAIVYSVLYEGHWPVVRDYVNILDKGNWDLFGIYALIVWSLALIITPGCIYFLSFAGVKISKTDTSGRSAFLISSGALLPLGLMLWIAFVIPMLFVNISFILQSLSDPFGWGWDFLGTANTPWHQLLPRYIPIFQSVIILTGTCLSLRNLRKSWHSFNFKPSQELSLLLPLTVFIVGITVAMLFFFTN
jgi:4Fe-4S binding domain